MELLRRIVQRVGHGVVVLASHLGRGEVYKQCNCRSEAPVDAALSDNGQQPVNVNHRKTLLVLSLCARACVSVAACVRAAPSDLLSLFFSRPQMFSDSANQEG